MPFNKVANGIQSVALQYFSENPEVTKIRRNVVYTLLNGQTFQLPRSIIKAKTTSGHTNYFEFGKTLGQGSYGVVKMARNLITGEELAVKIQHPENADPKSITKFAKNLEIEESFMADPSVDLLIAQMNRVGSARSLGAPKKPAQKTDILKFYSIQKLLKGMDLSEMLEAEISVNDNEIKPAAAASKPPKPAEQEKLETDSFDESEEDDVEYLSFVVKEEPADEEDGEYSSFVEIDEPAPKAKQPVSNLMDLFRGTAVPDKTQDSYDLNEPVTTADLLTITRVIKNSIGKLQKIHAAGILHLDIKPQNMRIVPQTLDITFFDYGVSQRLSPTEKEIEYKTQVGTPFYMAPEIKKLSGPTILSPMADVYSLGKTFKEMIEAKYHHGKAITLNFRFNNPEDSLNIHLLNEIAEIISDMLIQDRKERIDLEHAALTLQKIEYTLLAQHASKILKDKTDQSIIDALKLLVVSKGRTVTPSEAVQFITQQPGMLDTKALRAKIKSLLPKANAFSAYTIADQLDSEELPALEDAPVAKEDPLLVMQTSRDFCKALEALKRQTPSLTRSEAMAFARTCETQRLCTRVEARNAILKAGL